MLRLQQLQKLLPFKPIAVILGVVLGLDALTYFWAEGLWFQEVNYLSVFWIRFGIQVILGFLAFGLSFAWLSINLALAQRWRYRSASSQPMGSDRPSGLRLRSLLPLTLGLALLMGMMVLYQAQLFAEYWRPTLTLYSDVEALPIQFRPAVIWEIGQQLSSWPWGLAIILAIAIPLLLYPQFLESMAALLMSLGFGLVISEQWTTVLPYFRPTLFDQVDPLFNQDISFYIFILPAWQLLEFWLIGLFSFGLVAVALVYLLSGNSLSQGYFPGFSLTQQQHLCANGSALMAAIAMGHWLARYELLKSPRGVTYGASFTDVHVQLPINTALSLFALGIAIALLWRACFWGLRGRDLLAWSRQILQKKTILQPPLQRHRDSARPVLYGLGLYLVSTVIAGLLIPAAVQQLVVEPNELELERPYIERTIALTRDAFDLSDIEEEVFDPEGTLTFADLEENDLTVSNIRLWDTRPLLKTNRQLQEIRLYYEFLDADVDRYPLLTEDGDTQLRQVLIAARELNYERVPSEAQTWVNEHLIYTHGYGFTMSPVNTAGPSGLPDYFVRGIDQIVSSDRIRQSIPLGEPRIYYGELTNTYVMTRTEVQELDYPSGDENIYNSYSGNGGINIGVLWRRLLYAKHLRDWKMLFTQDFTPDTKLLFRRNIAERVKTIAPFLRYDSDPYLVVANPDIEPNAFRDDPAVARDQNHLYWIIDAYITSDRYPYSDPYGNDFNYIRNSVKVVIDAYHGTATFYIVDTSDPIIQTWDKIFPGTFHPLTEMPLALRRHIRYPNDFYQVQANQIMPYHMTDPQVFYNREDQWRAPNEIYANEAQRVEPYYLILNLPGDEDASAEFILFQPFTPAERNNLIAWLAARSDLDQYGKKLLYRFPKQQLVFGPEQIEARINQDPIISQQISLWNRQGSRAIQGNLLVIPIERSLLYVEPLYLEAEQNQLPTLARVIVAYENRIAMAETLDQALAAIFRSDAPSAPPILREVEDEPPLGVDESLTPGQTTDEPPFTSEGNPAPTRVE